MWRTVVFFQVTCRVKSKCIKLGYNGYYDFFEQNVVKMTQNLRWNEVTHRFYTLSPAIPSERYSGTYGNNNSELIRYFRSFPRYTVVISILWRYIYSLNHFLRFFFAFFTCVVLCFVVKIGQIPGKTRSELRLGNYNYFGVKRKKFQLLLLRREKSGNYIRQ